MAQHEAFQRAYAESLEEQLRENSHTIQELRAAIGDRDQAARTLASEAAHQAAREEDLRARALRLEQTELAVRQREERCAARERDVGKMLESAARQKHQLDQTQASTLQDTAARIVQSADGGSPSRRLAGSPIPGSGGQNNNNSSFFNGSGFMSNGQPRVSSVTNVAGRLYPQQQQQHQEVFGGPRAAGFNTSAGVSRGNMSSDASPIRRTLADDEIASLVRRVQNREEALRRVIDDEHIRRMHNLSSTRR